MELASHGITVNLVALAWIPTERHASCSKKDMDDYAASVPMKRMGETLNVASAVLFFASENAKFITGQKLSVNGGNSLI